MYKVTQKELALFLKLLDDRIATYETLDYYSTLSKESRKKLNNLIKIQDKWKRQQS